MSGRSARAVGWTTTTMVLGSLLGLTLTLAGAPRGAVAVEASRLEGAWTPELYVLRDGTELAVTGLIFFTEREWTVLFFVVDEDGRPRRGSGEGGTYTLEGERLTFVHHYHLSAGEPVGGLPEAPLRMSVTSGADATSEPCRVEVGERTMTIYFPTGNEMRFRRA